MPNALARKCAGAESLDAGRPCPEPFFDGPKGILKPEDPGQWFLWRISWELIFLPV